MSSARETTGGVVRPYVHDYRNGKTGWGHAIHSGIWQIIPANTVTTGRLWWRKTATTPERIRTMIHAQKWPEPGDRLLMTGGSGKEWNLRIAEVEPCGNPRDMFAVVLEDDTTTHPDQTHDEQGERR
jgi:hypothetical protein